MTRNPTRSEASALLLATSAFESAEDRSAAILAAGRAFRDAMPPRKATAADHRPDTAEAGRAAKKVLDAADRGILRQPVEEILVMAGRALIEAAYPVAKQRPSFGKVALARAGRAANDVYDEKDDGRTDERTICISMGRAGLQAANTASTPRRKSA